MNKSQRPMGEELFKALNLKFLTLDILRLLKTLQEPCVWIGVWLFAFYNKLEQQKFSGLLLNLFSPQSRERLVICI